ncbi:MAG: RNA-processing protein [Nanoarchaeota archaeon]|nr:RNA-processing protein [Nanoarchaeota archaeon]
MTIYKYELKVPKERVAVLIGTKGKIKKTLEQETKTKIEVDSKEGDVFISGEDALTLLTIKDIITAIGRGFNPDIALSLLKSDYAFELINISDFFDSRKGLVRIKGRVIGRDGKSRMVIEELSECQICVYGKTIGIIGRAENTGIARRAVDMLLRGATHASVYRWLEKQRRDIKRKEFLG